jgi:hypothetical protein
LKAAGIGRAFREEDAHHLEKKAKQMEEEVKKQN